MKPYGHKCGCWDNIGLDVDDIQKQGYKTAVGGKSYVSSLIKARIRRTYKKKERKINYEYEK